MGAVWAEGAGQTETVPERSQGCLAGLLSAPSAKPLSRKFEVAGRTDLLWA